MSRFACTGFLFALMLVVGTASAGGNTLTVTEVIAADVVRFGESFTCRLTGIAAPTAEESALGAEILSFTKRELEGKVVKVFTWTTDNTAAGIVYDDGNAFVQIYYGDDFAVSFNELMLRNGYARVDTTWLPEDLQHYRDLEQSARDQGRGILGDQSAAGPLRGKLEIRSSKSEMMGQ